MNSKRLPTEENRSQCSWTGPNGDRFDVAPLLDATGPAVSILITNSAGRAVADIPAESVDDLIAGIRAARDAAVGAAQ